MDLETVEHIKRAEQAIAHAQEVRAFHARRTPRGSKQREDDIKLAQVRIKNAMAPLRSFLGGVYYGPDTEAFRRKVQVVEKTSEALQKERRKLWKMSTTRQKED